MLKNLLSKVRGLFSRKVSVNNTTALAVIVTNNLSVKPQPILINTSNEVIVHKDHSDFVDNIDYDKINAESDKEIEEMFSKYEEDLAYMKDDVRKKLLQNREFESVQEMAIAKEIYDSIPKELVTKIKNYSNAWKSAKEDYKKTVHYCTCCGKILTGDAYEVSTESYCAYCGDNGGVSEDTRVIYDELAFRDTYFSSLEERQAQKIYNNFYKLIDEEDLEYIEDYLAFMS